MAPRPSQDKWQQATRNALDKLDIRAEYRELGLDITGDSPSATGWLECRAFRADDINPSAGVNIGPDHPTRGRYKSFVADGENLSLFEFAARAGKFPTWQDARNHYLEKAGVKLPATKPPKSPVDSLEFRDYNTALVELWVSKKPGISEHAVRICGGRLANEGPNKTPVVALPAYGPALLDDSPCGWVCWNVTGGPLEIFQGKGNPTKSVKMKTASGSKAGWMGHHGLANLSDAEYVWVTEGPSDMLGLVSRIAEEAPAMLDRQIVLCNSAGAMERHELDSVAIFAGKRVIVVPDCDAAGQAGCRRRAQAIAEVAAEVRFVRLPFEITPNHGKDLRDFFALGKTLADLGVLMQAAEVIRSQAAPRSLEDAPELGQQDGTGGSGPAGTSGSDESGVSPINPAEQSAEHLMMQTLGLDVLGELEDGKAWVFSEFHRKMAVIPDVDKLKYAKLLQIAGPRVKSLVHQGAQSVPGMFRFADVKEAIGELAGYRRVDAGVSGPGCWQGLDQAGKPTDSIILVGAGEAAVRNGRPGLTKIVRPRYGGRLIDISTSAAWYDYESLNQMVLECSPQFAGDALGELECLLGRWRWKNQQQAPKVIAGLVMATWIQTLWNWRPQVSINGKSNTGKSTLFEMLKSLFGPLTICSSDTTAAGLRQALKNSAAPTLVDEFEAGRNRTEILEMFRSSGRGGKVMRGSANHKGQEFALRHIFWTAGIESGLVREADKNRFILQELVPPLAGEYGKLSVMSESELGELGQRILAVALTYAIQAKELANQLRILKYERINQRLVECYAVPAACYSAVMGESAGAPSDVLGRMLTTIEIDEDMDDERQLLMDILQTEIHLGQGAMDTVANLLSRLEHNDSFRMTIETKGVGMVAHGTTKEMFISHRVCRRNLLRGTPWESQNIDQILLRLHGAEKCKKYLGGQRPWGVVIPAAALAKLGVKIGGQDPLSPDGPEGGGEIPPLWATELYAAQ